MMCLKDVREKRTIDCLGVKVEFASHATNLDVPTSKNYARAVDAFSFFAIKIPKVNKYLLT